MARRFDAVGVIQASRNHAYTLACSIAPEQRRVAASAKTMRGIV